MQGQNYFVALIFSVAIIKRMMLWCKKRGRTKWFDLVA